MKERCISTYYGKKPGDYAGRRADVCKDDYHYYVRFYRKDKLLWTEIFSGKSEAWAEDVAENYVLGVGSFSTSEMDREHFRNLYGVKSVSV